MAGNRTIQKIITVLLILVFSQKMGVGLYLHNWLHASKAHASAACALTNDELKYACSCISDFTTPIHETDVQELPVPVSRAHRPAIVPVLSLPVIYKYFHSLRAPPAPLA